MTLHLILKEKWYRMIERGEKTEEYREIKPFWIKRLCYIRRNGSCKLATKGICIPCFWGRDPFIIDNYTHVFLQNGYKREGILKEIAAIDYGFGNPEWGAPKGKKVFIIKFKEGD